MKISLSDLGKRYNREWIFRHINFEFESGNHCAITGANGSGKSTLLQIIAGAVHHTEGNIQFLAEDSIMSADQHYRKISLAAPYLELPWEMTLIEFLLFHFKLKPILKNLTIESIISIIDLEKSTNKQIRYFSSGMTQRVKLAQAIFTDTPIVLLDEPCTNLDDKGIALYHSLISNFCENRLVIVSSNDQQEYKFCTCTLPIQRYKKEN
jgi:ABC-type multidrug transport system ATPase subunit